MPIWRGVFQKKEEVGCALSGKGGLSTCSYMVSPHPSCCLKNQLKKAVGWGWGGVELGCGQGGVGVGCVEVGVLGLGGL